MSAARHDPLPERLEELLADRAMIGLTVLEEDELARLLAETAPEVEQEYELAAAALDRALAPRPEPLPAALRARLVAAARERVPSAPARAPQLPAPRSNALALAGWLVAAAACLLAVFAWRARAPAAPRPTESRAELLARAGTVRLDWKPEQTPGASGDVVWSQALQQGWLRIRGLAPNDPAREQFQLWIFDETQQHPIDGGVFDVAPGDEVLIPIDAKLRVQQPKLFAVTREKPGGVVVSDQQRIVLVAQP